jgi:transcriptional regulator with XRE-family HTH domain
VADGEPDPDRIATQQDFGRELSALKTRAGLTVRKVARVTGLPVSTVGDYFSGRHLPTEGVPISWLGSCERAGSLTMI